MRLKLGLPQNVFGGKNSRHTIDLAHVIFCSACGTVPSKRLSWTRRLVKVVRTVRASKTPEIKLPKTINDLSLVSEARELTFPVILLSFKVMAVSPRSDASTSSVPLITFRLLIVPWPAI